MKAKLASKGAVSILLAILMIVSMITIGIVNASSAEVDVAESSASVIEVWFTRPGSWSNNPNVHYWGGASSSSWPGQAMTWKYNNDYSQAIYYTTIPADSKNIIFNNGNGSYQTVDIALPSGKTVVAYYVSGNETSSSATVAQWQDTPDSQITPATEAPTTAPSTQYDVYLADNTTEKWVGNDNAKIYVGDTELKKTVDEHTGWTVWTAKIAVNNNSNITFKRVSAIDKNTVWNSWSGTFNSNNPCYVVSGDGSSGSFGTAPTIPAGTATDFWYGIWADTKGNGDTKDFVKIYATDLYGSTDYYLYLPSYVNRSAVTVYTSLYDLKIGANSVPRATPTVVNLSAAQYNLSYKRYTTGSTHTDFKLHVEKTTGVSAMLMSTKNDLYVGLTGAYAVKEDGTTPDYEGVAAYKATVETKGDYVFYTKDGAMLNPMDKTTGEYLTTLKKLKARGNSTFEASMRLYGKTAYNITLNDKAQLIEGCESSKKYSLLANNADESLLRNATVYGIADEVGMPYTPNTRLIDLYDNGNYLGAYVLTEKVEYGKNTLIPDAKSSDKLNEDILAAGKGIDYDGLKQKTATYTAKSGTTYTYQYSYTSETGKNYEFDGSTVTIGEGEEAETYTLDEALMKKYDFLMEHEIETRYSVEPTWFRSNRTKQAVVPKYPEFATQKQVQWMIEQYDALEDAAYDNDYTRVQAAANVETFADVYLIQELTMNLDACATSYYILGGKSYPKLVAAPLWDYDWAAGQYNGKRRTVPANSEIDVADTSKTYVKNKSVSTGDDGRNWGTYNLQAQLCHQSGFWTVCKSRWTNKFDPVLKNYLGDGNTLLTSSLPEYRSAVAMNESRWGNLERNYQGAHGSNPAADTWGTRSTITYVKGSNNFGVGQYYAPGSTKSYDNAVYYLNDWLLLRQINMSGSMGLYDASLIEPETEAPTDPPTEAPTAAPTEAPTAAPTEAPTDAPTEAPTTPPTEKPTSYDPFFEYILGDVDGDGIVTVMDATKLQQIIAGYEFEDRVRMGLRSMISGNSLNILDATLIQRYLVGYDDGYGINEVTPW